MKSLLKKTKVQIGIATVVLAALTKLLPPEWHEVGYLIVIMGLTIIGAHFGTDVAHEFATKNKPNG